MHLILRTLLVLSLISGLFTLPVKAAVKDVAWLQGSALDDGTTVLFSSTPRSISWTETSSIDPGVYDHALNDAGKLVVKQDGDYLVAVTLPLISVLDPDQRPQVAMEVYLNGAPAPGTVGRSAYIRNQPRNANMQRESSNHAHALLKGLKASDVIEVRVWKAGNAAVQPILTAIQSASLYVERVDASRPVFAALASGPTSGTNINPDFHNGGEPAAELAWVSTRKDGGFTHTDNAGAITLTAGTYLVFVNVPTASSVVRASPGLEVLVGGVVVPGGRASQGYIRNTEGHNAASVHWSGLVQVSGTQPLTVQMLARGQVGNATVQSGKQASIYVERLNGTTGQFLSAAAEVSNANDPTNWNPADKAALIWASPATVIDSALFAQTAQGTQIQVKQAGSYLLVYDDQLQSTVVRPNPRITVEINGEAVRGAETKSHYIRSTEGHNYSSAALAFLLEGLDANDVITVSTQREGNSGSVTIDETAAEGAILGLIKKETLVLSPTDTTPPRVTYFSGNSRGFEIRIEDFGRGIDNSSVVVKVNGQSVTATVTRLRSGTSVVYSYPHPDFPPTGADQSVEISFRDALTPPGTHQVALQYNVTDAYTRIPAGFATVGVDMASSGFTANVTQISDGQIATGANNLHGNTIAGAESQLRGEFVDENNVRYRNEAGPETATSWVVPSENVETINFEQTGADAGNFTGDQLFPRIPGWGATDNGIVIEFLGFLELKKGFHTLGVNSDDGFELRIGAAVKDRLALVAGFFNAGRGAADSLFDILVEEDGIYPVRLLWFEGGGGASAELFSVVNGEKVLINDRANPNAIKAYRVGPVRPYVSDISIAEGFRGIVRRIDMQITDGTIKLVDGSVKMQLDGKDVTATATRQGDVTSVAFDNGAPVGPGPHTLSINYDEGSTPVKTRNVRLSFYTPYGFVPILEDAPVRYFRFGETSGDQTSSELGLLDNPELIGTATVQNGGDLSAPGFFNNGSDGSAIRLDGSQSQRVIVPNGNDINQVSGPWDKKTIELWFNAVQLPRINADGTVQTAGIWEQGGGDRAILMYLYGTQNSDNPTEADLVFYAFNRLNAGSAGAPFGAPENEAAGIGPVTVVRTPIKANEVYHAVGVMDGDATSDDAGENNLAGKLILYVNGEEKSSISGVGQIYNHTGDVQIGRGNARLHDDFVGDLGFFNGVIDEIALYNVALPAARVKAHYDQAQAAPPPDNQPPAGAPVIDSIQVVGGNVQIQWQGNARLQQATVVTGPYTDVAGASSPYSTAIVAGEARFYRLAR